MIKTEFYFDFLQYYDKARILQNKNLKLLDENTKVNDPIMDNITIYDVINRRFAGFSKALEDVHGVRARKDLVKYEDYSKDLNIDDFHLVHLFHRFTGSGASFEPTFLKDGSRNPKEHGYYNNHVEQLCECLKANGYKTGLEYIVTCNKPMVTSKGNQPPSLKNKQPEKYRLAMQYYFDNFAFQFVHDYIEFLITEGQKTNNPVGIKTAVDWCCKWHKDRGFKQWHFVLTAFVMDTAEYYPVYVNPASHCYYGANAIKALKLMFEKEPSDKMPLKAWYEKCMEELVKAKPTSYPYEMEDVLCDIIRYWTEYVPKGYEHLTTGQTRNNSSLKCDIKSDGHRVYTLPVQDRIKVVCGL